MNLLFELVGMMVVYIGLALVALIVILSIVMEIDKWRLRRKGLRK